MKKNIVIYLITLLVFFAIDLFWILFIAGDMYQKEIGQLLLAEPRILPAIMFYILLILGFVVFAVKPALQKNSPKDALMLGGLFGLLTYATYGLTNLSLLSDWTTFLAVSDILWGGVLGALVSVSSFFINYKINKA